MVRVSACRDGLELIALCPFVRTIVVVMERALGRLNASVRTVGEENSAPILFANALYTASVWHQISASAHLVGLAKPAV